MTTALQNGKTDMTVSREWANRPDDQKFLSLTDLKAYTERLARNSVEMELNVNDLYVTPSDTRNGDLDFSLGGRIKASATNWSFGQICSEIGVPANYLKTLPASLAADNLNYALDNADRTIKAYSYMNGSQNLRAITSPRYGRLYDSQVVDAVMKIAGNGTGDTQWKVPGVLDWGTGIHNPFVDVTKDNTTLYASDRDVFMFLVDDTHPIEIGKLPNGNPDMVFRGFYVWNSEVGARTFGVSTMYMRAVCANRILWGVEGFETMQFYHLENTHERFFNEVVPALNRYSEMGTDKLLGGIQAARAAIVAENKQSALEFLTVQGFTKKDTLEVVAAVENEEGKLPESIWDFVQGITAYARKIQFADKRLGIELKAQKLLDKVAA